MVLGSDFNTSAGANFAAASQLTILKNSNELNTIANKSTIDKRTEINNLNNELSSLTHKIQIMYTNHSIKNKISVYLIIALSIIIVSHLIYTIAYAYSYKQYTVSELTNIDTLLSEYI